MSDIETWLDANGLSQYATLFADNAIDVDVLGELEREDFKDLGIPIGDIRRLLRAIRQFAPATEQSGSPSGTVHEVADGKQDSADAQRPLRSNEAERRQLTVMFADMVGSTELTQTLDPEVLRDLNRAYQDAAKAAIEKFGGFVARYMGDGVLAYFGYPLAHEDDPERAILAGLELRDTVAELEVTQVLAVRIGIATGPVVVGDIIGEGASQESAVVGETPNLAARLQSFSAPDTVVVGPTTKRLAATVFEYASLGEQRLKGITDPVEVWEVLRENVAGNRLEARGGSHLAPLVGRDEELGLLVSRWNSASRGEGQLVYLTGEAGIGKSRITEALLKEVQPTPSRHVRYFCSPHHTGSALHPVIAQLKRAAGFASDDCAQANLEKIEQLTLAAYRPKDHVPVLATLLSIPLGDSYPPLELSPEALKTRTLNVLADMFSTLAQHQPVLMLLEDAQWIDPTTDELIGITINRLQEHAALLIVTSRPEFSATWKTTHFTALSLSRLGRRAGQQMIAQLTGSKPFPNDLLEHVLSKTDGVPLFLEELTKTILESDVLIDTGERYALKGPLPESAVPVTLQDSLMARLDRLGEIREVAQVAAVIGRSFSFSLLLAISHLDEDELTDALARLVDAEMVYQRGAPPEATYTFKHALVQDAAYGSLLHRRREEVHGAIAAAMLARLPDLASVVSR